MYVSSLGRCPAQRLSLTTLDFTGSNLGLSFGSSAYSWDLIINGDLMAPQHATSSVVDDFDA